LFSITSSQYFRSQNIGKTKKGPRSKQAAAARLGDAKVKSLAPHIWITVIRL
jgi:hypothetical protein